MKQAQFTEEQVVRILQQAQRREQTIADLCCEHGVSQKTFYR